VEPGILYTQLVERSGICSTSDLGSVALRGRRLRCVPFLVRCPAGGGCGIVRAGGEIGGQGAEVRGDVVTEVTHEPGHDVLRLAGPLSLATAPVVRATIGKLLAERGRVVVDLSALRLEWQPAVELFPAALAAAGGWPVARLVLAGARAKLTMALRAARVPSTVPLVTDLAAALARLDDRPLRVTRHRDLPPHPAAPGSARAFVREACTDWDLLDLVPSAALVVTELVSNAVEHARTRCRVTVNHDGRGLHLGVRDFYPSGPLRPAPVDVTALRGRGLHIVIATAANWGVTAHSDGKTVWATVPAAP
jgi:anti-sigma regulatory factor (Ser/Thr protein kinase)